jgi:hypothetical protein
MQHVHHDVVVLRPRRIGYAPLVHQIDVVKRLAALRLDPHLDQSRRRRGEPERDLCVGRVLPNVDVARVDIEQKDVIHHEPDLRLGYLKRDPTKAADGPRVPPLLPSPVWRFHDRPSWSRRDVMHDGRRNVASGDDSRDVARVDDLIAQRGKMTRRHGMPDAIFRHAAVPQKGGGSLVAFPMDRCVVEIGPRWRLEPPPHRDLKLVQPEAQRVRVLLAYRLAQPAARRFVLAAQLLNLIVPKAAVPLVIMRAVGLGLPDVLHADVRADRQARRNGSSGFLKPRFVVRLVHGVSSEMLSGLAAVNEYGAWMSALINVAFRARSMALPFSGYFHAVTDISRPRECFFVRKPSIPTPRIGV